jgi:Type III restriction enzyme, res subunit/Helicase conserved C-terminal domain
MFTEQQIEAIVNPILGYDLRKEYQPKAICGMINAYYGPGDAQKIICGCGGGKSLMMHVSLALAIIHGDAQKIVITAPTIALCRQLENDFIELLVQFKTAGQNVPKGIRFLNVSSDGKQKSTSLDLDDDEFNEEHEGLEDLEPEQELDINQCLKLLKADKDTTQDHEKIKDELISKGITIFFVCKPSFLKSFHRLVRQVAQEQDLENVIDITCHDEFHNLITQDRQDRTKTTLTIYKHFSKHNWFFSASKKYGEKFGWNDPLFGTTLIDVSTGQLVEWKYLVPEIKIYTVTAGSVRQISEAIKQKFKMLDVPNPERFYQEAAVILRVMQHQMEIASVPKIIHFTHKVAFIKEMMKSVEFQDKLKSVIDNLVCYQMDGSTKKEDRAQIFENLKAANDELATCLLQHSTCKEGINCPNFNVGIIARGMSEISLQQSLGRIQRAAPGKEVSHLYVFVGGDEQQLIKLALFLHYNFGDYTYSIQPITDDYIGNDDEEADDFPYLEDVKITLKDAKVTIVEYIDHLKEKEKQLEQLFYIRSLSEEELDNQCPM